MRVFLIALAICGGASMSMTSLAQDNATLAAALAARGPDYVPRTHHVRENGQPEFINRLILERSPYLLQHAHNPIDWRPWGEAAFIEAQRRDVPIFISIGYATCHWCHVMERESFDNKEVGAEINRNYVAIKVDREELPHIDTKLMLATTVTSGSGGWPNNLFLTPTGEPIVALGYVPRAQFLRILSAFATDWKRPEGRQRMETQARSLEAALRSISDRSAAAVPLDESTRAELAENLMAQHDDFEGGFGNAPKFPNEVYLRFLLDHAKRAGDQGAQQAALFTLRAIAAGGIHDHVGGGFHRYVIDPNWRTPHFEKMLYNQALLSSVFVEAWRQSGEEIFARAARRALDYVLRDMSAPEGAFYAAEDADSADEVGVLEEGAFYLWHPTDAQAHMPQEEHLYALETLGLLAPPTMPLGAVIHLDPASSPDFERLDPLLETLRQARASRARPLTDTKLITEWNGMMIRALAQGAMAFDEPRYRDAALKAAEFIWAQSRLADGGLARAWSEGGPMGRGTLSDYAYLGLGFLALEDATGDANWRERARALAGEIWPRFGGERVMQNGQLLTMNEALDGSGFADATDNATPSGISGALELLARMTRRGQHPELMQQADALRDALSGLIVASLTAHPEALLAATIHAEGPLSAQQHLGHGAVRAHAKVKDGTFRLSLEFAEGWHSNSATPVHNYLLPTSLSGKGLGAVTYPKARQARLGFQSEPLEVIDGNVILSAPVSGKMIDARLSIQICSEETCLAPEEARFILRPS